MLDGLVLQIILTTVVVIATIIAAVWFIWGLKEKSAPWIVALAVPVGLVIAVILALLSA